MRTWMYSLREWHVEATKPHRLSKEEARNASSSATERFLRVVEARTMRRNTDRGLGWGLRKRTE